jgi:hypothetical protein
MHKDPDEIELLTLAAHAADRVVAQIAAGRLVGRTEADVAHELRERPLDLRLDRLLSAWSATADIGRSRRFDRRANLSRNRSEHRVREQRRT